MKKIWILFLIPFLVSCQTLVGWEELVAGKKYVRQSNYGKAIRTLSEGIKKNPDHWKFYYYRGMAHESLNETDAAIDDMTGALDRIDKGPGKLPKDEWAMVYLRRGRLYDKRGDYQFAIDDYNAAHDLDPDALGPYFYRAATKVTLNRLPSAIEDYSLVIDKMHGLFSGISDKDKARVCLGRARAYRKQNKFKLALADNDHAIKYNDSADAFLSRGTTQLKKGNFEEAVKDFGRTIEKDPSEATAYLYRACIRLITDCDLDRVLEDYEAVTKIISLDNETLQQVCNSMAWILATTDNDRIRDPKKARRLAKKAVRINRSCYNLDTLAAAYASFGKFDDAITTQKEAIERCRLDHPEILSEVEKHLAYYKQKKSLEEECPASEIEKVRLRAWRMEGN